MSKGNPNYGLTERPIKLKVPIELCDKGHLHVPVKGKCLMCERDNKYNHEEKEEEMLV